MDEDEYYLEYNNGDDCKEEQVCNGDDLRMRFECGVCWRGFTSEDEYIVHKQNIHPSNDVYRCLLCRKNFPSDSEMEKHNSESHGADYVAHGGHVKNDDQLLKKQTKTLTKTKTLTQTKTQTQTKTIMNLEKKDSPRRLTVIKLKMSETHKKDAHYSKKHICEFCGQVFKTKMSYVRHVKSHVGKNPYFCDICDKRFRYKSKLNAHHDKTHATEDSFQCQICEKGFRTSDGLKRHSKIHIGEKTSDILNVHNGAKPYKCDICGNEFTTHNHLTRHIKNHTVNYGYKCEECNKEFLRLKDVKTHSCLPSQ